MTRLETPDPSELPDDVRRFLKGFPSDPIVAMLSYSSATVELFIRQAQAQFTDLALSDRLREVVILTVAAGADCEFVAAQHQPMAADAGISSAERTAIATHDLASAQLDRVDRTVVEFVAAVVQSPRVPDSLFAEVRAALSNREIVEVLQVCGYYWTLARIATVLDVELTTIYGKMPPIDDD